MIDPRPETPPVSPRWSPTAKLVVGLTFMAALAALFATFRPFLGPLLLALILVYILHPAASWVMQITRLSWRGAVNVIFLIVIIVLLGAGTLVGLAVVQQAQNLITVVQRALENLPQMIATWSTLIILIGPFQINVGEFISQNNLAPLLNDLRGVIQPALGRVGTLISTVATGTLSTLGWTAFILLISYFTLADAGRVPNLLAGLEIPGHNQDFQRLIRELARIWRTFLRGQLFLFAATVAASGTLLTILGVRNALAIAFLAGGARFVPYVGPFVTWGVTAIVAGFQPANYFQLQPGVYALVVVLASVVLDQVFDSVITPRFFGEKLGLYPAAVLVAALVAANVLGIVGLLVAAPMLATLKLFTTYALRKMFDQDPWPQPETIFEPEFPGLLTLRRWWEALLQRQKTLFKGNKKHE